MVRSGIYVADVSERRDPRSRRVLHGVMEAGQSSPVILWHLPKCSVSV
ncbi:MAG: hypothetical protein QOG38_2157 [Hyphomicrobiales bacterium]|nr:hypothetical protein [Hyphomicrobiales bacterium]